MVSNQTAALKSHAQIVEMLEQKTASVNTKTLVAAMINSDGVIQVYRKIRSKPALLFNMLIFSGIGTITVDITMQVVVCRKPQKLLPAQVIMP